jgi:hypothetical protein
MDAVRLCKTVLARELPAAWREEADWGLISG